MGGSTPGVVYERLVYNTFQALCIVAGLRKLRPVHSPRLRGGYVWGPVMSTRLLTSVGEGHLFCRASHYDVGCCGGSVVVPEDRLESSFAGISAKSRVDKKVALRAVSESYFVRVGANVPHHSRECVDERTER